MFFISKQNMRSFQNTVCFLNWQRLCDLRALANHYDTVLASIIPNTYDTSVYTLFQWELQSQRGEMRCTGGKEETVLQCYFLSSQWLTVKLPQSHRKTCPKGDQKWMIVYSLGTHACWWNAAHTNRGAPPSDKSLERRAIMVGGVFKFRVHWSDGYQIIWTQNREGGAQRTTPKWEFFCTSWRPSKLGLAAHILHSLENTFFTQAQDKVHRHWYIRPY